MLGLRRKKGAYPGWQWHVSGKHPAAGDFFALGVRNAVTDAFSAWIRRGAEEMAGKSRDILIRSRSWRFWARSAEKGMLACGVIRNSSDSAGRPFPLLVMGMGRLHKWENNWDLLPFACETAWSQMEKLAVQPYDSLAVLKDDVELLRPPRGDWDVMKGKRQELAARNREIHMQDMDVPVRDDVLFFSLYSDDAADAILRIGQWHVFLKERVKVVPSSLFFGGSMDNSALVLFKRALRASDFMAMWISV